MALLLSALLPLEAAHCAFMMLPGAPASSAAPAASDVDPHACCRTSDSGPAAPETPSPEGCACFQLPAAQSASTPTLAAPLRDGALAVFVAFAALAPLGAPRLPMVVERDEGPPAAPHSAPTALRGPPPARG